MADKKIKQITAERQRIEAESDMIATQIFQEDLEAEEIMHEMAIENEELAILEMIEEDMIRKEVEDSLTEDVEYMHESEMDENYSDECESEQADEEPYYDEYSYSIHNLYQIVAKEFQSFQQESLHQKFD
jgi:hypothetical protein